MNDERPVALLARDEASEAAGDVPGRVRNAIDGGRDLYRRGAVAIARTGGDNGALALLAAGTAVAAISWLVVRRRRGRADGRPRA